jgi:hypothetical protein
VSVSTPKDSAVQGEQLGHESAIKCIGISNSCRIWPCQNITLLSSGILMGQSTCSDQILCKLTQQIGWTAYLNIVGSLHKIDPFSGVFVICCHIGPCDFSVGKEA